jgi:purine-binding chemotaxis protein CheW
LPKKSSTAMAKGSQRAVFQVGAGARDIGAIAPTGGRAADQQVVVFWIADHRFGFQLDDVGEIIRVPRLTHMPLGPRSLEGLANLRGEVLPVVSLRRLLSLCAAPPEEAARVIVLDGDARIGFIVDRIDNLASVPAHLMAAGDVAGSGAVDPDVLAGVVRGAEGEDPLKIFNPKRLLRGEFAKFDFAGGRSPRRMSTAAVAAASAAVETHHVFSFVSFALAEQEYALPLDRVREIIPLPGHVAEIPRSETAVLGVVTLRDCLLPVVSLRALLGLPSDGQRSERGKVVVASLGHGAIGLVVDATREILRVDPGLIEPAPTLLTRGSGDAEITSICRLDNGRRLVAVLSPDRLFRSELMRRVMSEQGVENASPEQDTERNVMAEEQFIIFRLGGQEYGMPIAAVEEIARPPQRLTRIPKAPSFIDGMMNLRGIVVPIVDLRRRFDVASKEPGIAERVLVLAIGDGKTGFLVDSVSEVLKVPTDAVRPAPDLSAEQMRLIGRIANFDAQSRMILLVDPAQLLDQVEADMLKRFDRSSSQPAPKAS